MTPVSLTRRVLTAVMAVCLALLVAVGALVVAHARQDRPSARPQPSQPSQSAGASSAAPSIAPTTAPTPTLSRAPARPLPATLSPTSKPPRPRPTPTASPTAPTPATGATPPPATLTFTLTTFNVLGASHTKPGRQRPQFASGTARAAGAAALIRRHGSDVVGFQELQVPQLAALERRTDLQFFPGLSLGHFGAENSIGWRRDAWTLAEKHVVQIPYFAGGPRAMPVVKLRSRSTGLEAWFANFHNPAETGRFHHQERFRLAATRVEIQLANELIQQTALPVFFTGDMNERAPYFCRLTAGSPMVAARGGSNNGRCMPGRPRAVDWIFGSQGVVFSRYTEDRSHLVDITTDHPVVSAQVTITGAASAAVGVDGSLPQ